MHALLRWRAFDERSELYVNAATVGLVLELPPFAGIDEETLGALAGTPCYRAPGRRPQPDHREPVEVPRSGSP